MIVVLCMVKYAVPAMYVPVPVVVALHTAVFFVLVALMVAVVIVFVDIAVSVFIFCSSQKCVHYCGYGYRPCGVACFTVCLSSTNM